MNACKFGGDHKPSGVSPKILRVDDCIPQSFHEKKRKDVSDTRFKRIISQDTRKNSDRDAAKKKTVPSGDQYGDAVSKEVVISVLKAPKNVCPYLKTFDSSGENSSPDSAELVTRDPGFRFPDAQNKITSITSKGLARDFQRLPSKSIRTDLKKSASDCTLQKKYGNQDAEDLSKIRLCPSGSEVTSGKGCKPVKKRSVVTVIGQAQAKPMNVLLAINQRRKLAKELDKHAMCEAIVESNEIQTGTQNLLAKVDFVLPNGEVIYSMEKAYLSGSKHKECGGCFFKSSQNFEDEFKKRRGMISERDSSVSQVDKKIRTKRSSKKSSSAVRKTFHLKESVKRLKPKFFWLFLLIVLCLSCVCASIGSTKSLHSCNFIRWYFAPEDVSWYEKLLY